MKITKNKEKQRLHNVYSTCLSYNAQKFSYFPYSNIYLI